MLFLTIIIAILVFNNERIVSPENFRILENYLSSFTLGILYAYGFTASLATGSFLVVADYQNIILTGIIAGMGALIGDLIIFRFIRKSFNKELNQLSKTKYLKKARSFFNRHSVLNKIVPLLAYIIIASPLPDEIGVALAASYRDVTTKSFAITSYLLNTAGIFTILIIGKSF